MRKGIAYLIFLAVLTSFVFINENSFNLLIKNKLENYTETNWPEKLYVQTDKSIYAIDETIWFSAYLVNGITHRESSKSKVIHIELINDKDSIVQKHQLLVKDLSAAGDFKIKDEWNKGGYRLRAYTNYMRNDSPYYFFEKNIEIWSPREQPSAIDITNARTANEILSTNAPDLNFYPEGGYLVENLSSKVAFKIKNEFYHKGIVSGYISDNEGNLISHFKTFDLGMGLFIITPEANKTYFANFEINGSEYQYNLPKALPKGYVINTSYRTNDLSIDLNSNTEEGLFGSYLVLHQRGKILLNEMLEEKKNTLSFKLASNKLQDGLLHITLFNHLEHPVCERLVFIENEKNSATIQVNKNKKVFAPREKMDLDLLVEDHIKTPLPSALSISVKKTELDNYPIHSETIKTWLLLNSDLRGAIKNPAYLFSNPNIFKRKYLLDLVMMTNGWRRFKWQELLYHNDEDQFKAEKGITISGDTKLLEKPYTLTPAYTSLTLLGSEISTYPLQKSGSDGKFSFGPLEIYGSTPVFIQSRLNNFASKDEKDRQLSIFIDKAQPSPKILKKPDLIINKNDSLNYKNISKYLQNINVQYENIQKLDEVVVIAKNKEKEDARRQEMSDQSLYGYPNHRLDVQSDNFLNSMSMSSLLNQIPGVFFSEGGGFRIRGRRGNPRFELNDTQVTLEDVLNLLPIDISFMDYYGSAGANVFSNNSNGAIVIYTRSGSSGYPSRAKRKPGILNFKVQGFYTAKAFYSPDYSLESSMTEANDLRTTLYWNPRIRTTSEKVNQKISFSIGDLKGDYIIEIEGISDTGIPLYQTSTFTVE